jgi:lipopolysaccharide/colanic/teichoic acid biosynthesis glycosyltransferase
MSLVGPRPESPHFVERHGEDYDVILSAKPGITGLCQLAFAEESDILDPENRVEDYLVRLLPQKVAMDRLYAERRSMRMDLRILLWTAVAVIGRQDVAVDRKTGQLGRRRRPNGQELEKIAQTVEDASVASA